MYVVRASKYSYNNEHFFHFFFCNLADPLKDSLKAYYNIIIIMNLLHDFFMLNNNKYTFNI